MSKGKQKKTGGKPPQDLRQPRTGAEIPSGDPAFNGQLPHASKKVALGPNTQR